MWKSNEMLSNQFIVHKLIILTLDAHIVIENLSTQFREVESSYYSKREKNFQFLKLFLRFS